MPCVALALACATQCTNTPCEDEHWKCKTPEKSTIIFPAKTVKCNGSLIPHRCTTGAFLQSAHTAPNSALAFPGPP